MVDGVLQLGCAGRNSSYGGRGVVSSIHRVSRGDRPFWGMFLKRLVGVWVGFLHGLVAVWLGFWHCLVAVWMGFFPVWSDICIFFNLFA